MSIIHDALKKAGDERMIGKNTPSNARPIRIRSSANTNGFNSGLLILVAAFLIAGAIILTPVSKALHSAPQPVAPGLTPNAMTIMRPSSPGVSGQFGIEEMPTAGAFILSGVIVSSEGSYSIINDQIVSTGQQISGATVRSITDREVSLDYNGQKIILPVADKNTL